jgi:L-ascorbate metabolism protein UlaG (beta-lactamase superfamily)
VAAVLKFAGLALLALVIAGSLAAVIVPRFLDRIYYRGPGSDHFDGERFFNPDGDDTSFAANRNQGSQPAPSGGRLGFFWRQMTGADGRPEWPASVPVTPTRPAARVEGERMVATWIGHATVLVQTAGLNILTDPVWSERAGPFGFGPKRVAPPGVRFEDLPRIDLVLLSHNHYDHMDLATLKRLWDRDRPAIITSLGNDAILRARGVEATALDWQQGAYLTDGRLSLLEPDTDRPSDAEVFVTRNHHWGSRWFTDRNRALWSAFVVRLPSGGNLFFAGDTGFGDGRWPGEAAALGPVRLALIPVGAFRFVPGQMASGSHIGPADAALVFQRLGASAAIPIHWGTFRLSYEARDTPPRMLAAALVCLGGDAEARFRPAELGQGIEVPPAGAASRPSTPLPRERMMRCLDTPAVRAMR